MENRNGSLKVEMSKCLFCKSEKKEYVIIPRLKNIDSMI